MSATIAVFARAPAPGHCKTRLAHSIGADRAAELYAAMLLDSLDRLATVSAERYVLLAAPEHGGVVALESLAPPPWSVVAQEGATLGERMANAMRRCSGPGRLAVLVGSDSPTLPLAPLETALASAPPAGQVLVGPSEDGGYYLIGLTIAELPVLHDIPWSTADVLPATRRRCQELALPLLELPTWYDVDDRQGLERLKRELASRPSLAPRCTRVLAGWSKA